MFIIRAKNPNFNEERLGLKFKDGVAKTTDKKLAQTFKTDFVYEVMDEKDAADEEAARKQAEEDSRKSEDEPPAAKKKTGSGQ